MALGLTIAGCADDESPGQAEASTGSGSTTAAPDATSSTATTTGEPGETSADTTEAEPTTTTAAEPTTTTDASTTGDATTSGTTGSVPVCGDDVIDAGEACDGADLAGEDCVSQGFVGGVLACLPDCSGLDTTACSMGSSGACCAAHGLTGCDDPTCEATICGFDPYCCDTSWDQICADEALTNPACLDVGGACPCPDEDIGAATGAAVASGNSGSDDDDMDASCGGGGGNDRVILFTAPADASYTFDTFGSGYDTKLSLHADCATELSCNDDTAGLQSQVQLDMTAGQRVRIVIDGYNGATGEWVLNITAAPVMPPVCGDGVVEAPEICDGANLNGQTCIFQGYPAGGALACTADCLAFDPSGCIDGPYPCSDEDVGGTTGAAVASGNTVGDDDDLDGPCGGTDGNDHVVTFTAPAADTYTFDTFGSSYDTKLVLYADCLSELYCNDDAGGTLQSQLTINMGAGQDVLVVVDGYNGGTGAWVLNITPS